MNSRLKKLLAKKNQKLPYSEKCANLEQIAELYALDGDHDTAAETYKELLDLYLKKDDMKKAASIHRLLADCYIELESTDLALSHSEMNLDIRKQLKDPIALEQAYITCGRCFMLKAESDTEASTFLSKAISCFEASQKIIDSLTSHDPKLVAEMKTVSCVNLGLAYRKQLLFADANRFFEMAIHSSRKAKSLEPMLRAIYQTIDNLLANTTRFPATFEIHLKQCQNFLSSVSKLASLV
ncbi:T-complex-associated testis-expressed protein 1, partial [Cichlidogyrus casuarinus]